MFRYENGELFWKKPVIRGRTLLDINKPAGGLNNRGYWVIKLNKKIYLRSRLFILCIIINGQKIFIDHINRNRSDDRIENLRDSNKSKNGYNSKVKGRVPFKYITKRYDNDCKQGFIYRGLYLLYTGENNLKNNLPV